MIIWKKFIKWQYNILFPKEETTEEIRPEIKGEITINKAFNLMKEYCDPSKIFLSDSSYSVTTITEGKKYNETTGVADLKFITDTRDCDNFSFALHYYWNKGLESFATGIAWSNSHAFNIGIFKEKEKLQIYVIEPQSNKWFKIEDLKDIKLYYPIRVIVM